MNVVLTRRARATGTTVLLIDNRDQSFENVGMAATAEQQRQNVREARWATLCDEHGGYVLHGTRQLAEGWLPHPDEWCDGCKGR